MFYECHNGISDGISYDELESTLWNSLHLYLLRSSETNDVNHHLVVAPLIGNLLNTLKDDFGDADAAVEGVDPSVFSVRTTFPDDMDLCILDNALDDPMRQELQAFYTSYVADNTSGSDKNEDASASRECTPKADSDSSDTNSNNEDSSNADERSEKESTSDDYLGKRRIKKSRKAGKKKIKVPRSSRLKFFDNREREFIYNCIEYYYDDATYKKRAEVLYSQVYLPNADLQSVYIRDPIANREVVINPERTADKLYYLWNNYKKQRSNRVQ